MFILNYTLQNAQSIVRWLILRGQHQRKTIPSFFYIVLQEWNGRTKCDLFSIAVNCEMTLVHLDVSLKELFGYSSAPDFQDSYANKKMKD